MTTRCHPIILLSYYRFRLNGKGLTINTDLIEMIEETPDTVITLTTGKKIIVKESRQMVKNLVKLYRQECNSTDFVE